MQDLKNKFNIAATYVARLLSGASTPQTGEDAMRHYFLKAGGSPDELNLAIKMSRAICDYKVYDRMHQPEFGEESVENYISRAHIRQDAPDVIYDRVANYLKTDPYIVFQAHREDYALRFSKAVEVGVEAVIKSRITKMLAAEPQEESVDLDVAEAAVEDPVSQAVETTEFYDSQS